MSEDDARAIERLLHEYAERIDDGDFAGVGALFADGRVCGPDGTTLAEGAEAVQRLYERTTRRHEDGTTRTRHLVTNVVVDVGAERATARSTFTVLQSTPGVPLQPIAAGRYRDTFELVDGRWHFDERVMLPDFFGDVSEHLLIRP